MKYTQKLNSCLIPFYDRTGYGFIANVNKKGDFTKESYQIEDILQGQNYIDIYTENKTDTYYNVGIFKTGKSANMENILQVTELYCDIDNHLTGGFTLQEAEKTVKTISKYFDIEIPKPTRIDYTGRGLQCHWHLKECKDIAKWRIVQEGLQTLLDRIFEKESVLFSANSLKLDRLTNQNRYLRTPGTYNTKGKTYSKTLLEMYKLYDLNEIIKDYQIPTPTDGKRRGVKDLQELTVLDQQEILNATDQEKKTWSKTKKWYCFRTINEKRLSDLFIIQQLRNDRGYVEGYRSNMIREYCHIVKALYPGDRETQRERVQAFNEGFVKPLKQNEIKAWLRATWQSKDYRGHTNLSIIKTLDISLSEMENLETILTKQVKNARYYQANKSDLKEKRNTRYNPTKEKTRSQRAKRIIMAQELYRQGKTIREVSTMLKMSKTTVLKYIHS